MDVTKFERVRREQFPLVNSEVYMDTATTGIIPKNTRDAMVKFIDDRYEAGMDTPDFYRLWEYADGLRATVAKVIHADSDEIFFSGSGSDMLNVFSSGVELPPDANVVIS